MNVGINSKSLSKRFEPSSNAKYIGFIITKNQQPFKRQPCKTVKHTETIRWQFAGELFKFV